MKLSSGGKGEVEMSNLYRSLKIKQNKKKWEEEVLRTMEPSWLNDQNLSWD